MSAPRVVALLVDDDGSEPSLRLLRSQRAVERATAAGALVIGVDGQRVKGDEQADDLERLEQAHRAMTRRLGLPDPDLPDAAAHVAVLSYLGRLGPFLPRPGEDDPEPDQISVSCLVCIARHGWAGCPRCHREGIFS